ncbi:MAG: hypothetical protein EXR84_00930 [Gammaproteobacteria bacterium]|nr:hypothetical protein [Gammaproteobacteria bacterium]
MKITSHPSSRNPTGPLNTTRRTLLQALPALVFAPGLFAQGSPAPIAVQKLHSFNMCVSDVARSVAFYQDLFGAAVQARQGDTVCLRIGPGPRFFSLSPMQAGQEPGFTHIGLSVANFAVASVQAQLQAFGISPAMAPTSGTATLEHAMRSWTVTRGDTTELYFADVEGIVYQLASAQFCGGSGPQGEVCDRAEPASASGMFKLLDLSHFTNRLANNARANEFYTRVFGKQFQAYQGPTSPIIGVGDGIQFLMYVGGNQEGAPTQPGRIDHTCFSVEDFSVDGILAKLTDYGLTGASSGNGAPPLSHWVSMRMPNRGGVEGGTPEVYFSDPDGIHIQLQDASYCGGGGYLGNECAPLA